PVTQPGRLVEVQADVDGKPLLDRGGQLAGQQLGDGHVARGGVRRVAAEDQQRVDRAVADGRLQLFERLGAVGEVLGHRLGEQARAADVAEVGVDGVDDRVDDGRLAVAGDHDGATA